MTRDIFCGGESAQDCVQGDERRSSESMEDLMGLVENLVPVMRRDGLLLIIIGLTFSEFKMGAG